MFILYDHVEKYRINGNILIVARFMENIPIFDNLYMPIY